MYDVLIADDDEIICLGMKNTVNWKSVNSRVVATANDGDEALMLIRELHPHIAILDINMPFIDGLTLAEIISKEYPEIIVIMLTAYQEFQYAKKAIQCRVFDYLTKPCHNDDICKTIARAISQLEKADVHVEEGTDISLDAVDYFQQCEERIRIAVSSGDAEAISSAVNALFTQLVHTDAAQSLCISLSSEMLMKLYRGLGDEALEGFLQSKHSVLHRLNRANSQEVLRDCILSATEGLRENANLIAGGDQLAAVEQAKIFIKEHYSNSELTIGDVADSVHLSVSYLQVLLKKYLNTSFSNYLNQIRMEEAMRLLKSGNDKISSVAFDTGFNSSQYFSRKFKKHFGVEPREVKSK